LGWPVRDAWTWASVELALVTIRRREKFSWN
jgi:hypothetical protein